MRLALWANVRAAFRSGTLAALVLVCGTQSGCRAEPPWPLWDSYAQKFMDNQGRVIDRSGQDRTTTEGEAYAMFFALVAGDREGFDKLVTWTTDNLAQGDLTARLPAWSWGKDEDGSWHVLDSHPAADADLWMAYTLCEAGRLWKYPRYEKLGELMVARIAQQEVVQVPGVGTVLLPGAEGFHPDAKTWFVNPSYLPPELLVYFAKRDPKSPWQQVLESLPVVVQTDGGFVMDWMSVGGAGVHPAVSPVKPGSRPEGAGTSATPPAGTPNGSYDAIRAYLWVGMADPKTAGVKAAMARMHGMGEYLKGHSFPPLQVDAGGKVLTPDAPVGFSAAVIPYLHALGMAKEEGTQNDRLIALRDDKTGLFGREAAYYDQNLALFSMGWTEQRFRFESDGRLRLKWK